MKKEKNNKASIKKEEKKVEAKNVSKKESKTNIFKNIGKYFRGIGKEVKRIKWTSGKDLVKYSVAAISFVIFFGLYFYGIDWIALLVRSLAK